MRTLTSDQRQLLHQGTVIPAHPLVLDAQRHLDETRQRRLTRYYLACGVGGLAVGVHTTQFAIRDAGLLAPVLQLAVEEIDHHCGEHPFLRIAGVTGPTLQAVQEAQLAHELGYDLVLLSTNGLGTWSETALLDRARAVGEIMPIFGFYLQPAVGGKVLSRSFWEQLASIEAVKAIKIAPFDRYQTLDVVQAVCASDRANEIALYTGNDDNIFLDLLTTYTIDVRGQQISKNIVGGLLGHWAVWTQKAVAQLDRIKKLRQLDHVPASLLRQAVEVTDANAAFFDAANNFSGCIAGIHEVLRRQGLMEGTWCLDPQEALSPGQAAEIDRVYQSYPHLHDDHFVSEFLARESDPAKQASDASG